jgi:hypothetical protein
MPTTIDSAGIIFNDASTITSANTFIAKPASPSNGQVLGYNGSTWTGTSLSASPMVAKAYVDFWVADLANPIQAYNISSITDIGSISQSSTTGIGLQINFTTPMPTTKYSVFTGDYNAYCTLAADTGTVYNQPDASQTVNSFILFNAGSGRTRARYRAIVFHKP